MSAPIFISHSSKDSELALRLMDELEKRGIPCWISSRDIRSGEDYQHSIVESLNATPAMILLFTANANQSKQIPREVGITSNLDKPILPVIAEAGITPNPSLTYTMTTAQCTNIFDNFDRGVAKLIKDIQWILHKKEVPRSDNDSRGTKGAPKRKPLKALYAGVGCVVVLAAAAALFTLNSHDKQSPAVAHTDSSPAAISPPSETPRTLSAVAPTTKQVKATESVSSTVVEKAVPQPKGAMDELVAQVRQLKSSDRIGALQASPLMDNEKLSTAQSLTLLSGTSNSERARLLANLMTYQQPDMAVGDALKLANNTGDSWSSTIETLLPALADDLSDSDVLALLGNTSNSSRSRLLEKLLYKAKGPFDLDVTNAILRPMSDSRSNALQAMVGVLPHPLPESAFTSLLQTITNSSRARVIAALLPALGESVSVEGMLALIQNSGDSWTSALATLSVKAPQNLSPGDMTRLLGTTTSSTRINALQSIVSHLASGLKGHDLVSILRDSGDSWYSGVVMLVPHLAPQQDSESLLALLGATRNSTRERTVEALSNVLPPSLTINDANAVLNGTGDSRYATIKLLLPLLPHLTQGDIDQLANGLSPSQRKQLLALING